MKASEINDWLAVATNVGVIIGLAFVVYEVRLTNAALDREARIHRSEVLSTTSESWGAISFAMIENGEVADIWRRGNEGEELSPTDQLRFDTLAKAHIYQFRRLWDQYSLAYENIVPDWVIHFIIKDSIEDSPAIRPVLLWYMEHDPTVSLFVRLRELDPPWLVAPVLSQE